MKINDIVPPLELCRKIPAGEFADSALCWIVRPALYNETSKAKGWGYYVGFEFEIDKELKEKRHAPAPTLAEILAEIPDYVLSWDGKKHLCCIEISETEFAFGKTAVEAAFNLWLKKKGIEE